MDRLLIFILRMLCVHLFRVDSQGTTLGPMSTPITQTQEPVLQSLRHGPEDTYVFEGQTTILSCSVDNKVGKIHWKRNGIRITNEASILTDHDRLAIDGDMANGVYTYNLQISPTLLTDSGSYICVVMSVDEHPWLLSDPANLYINQGIMCYENLGIYQCMCRDAINRTEEAEVATVVMSPNDIDGGIYELTLTDGISECVCHRCVMDIDINTGVDLLKCNANVTEADMCPPPSNGTAWQKRFTEISAVTPKETTTDVIVENFEVVLQMGVKAIIEDYRMGNGRATVCTDYCGDITQEIDTFGLELIQELHGRYIDNVSVTIRMENIELGFDIALKSLVNEDFEEYTFHSDVNSSKSESITLPRQVLPTGTGYIVNVRYGNPDIVMKTTNASSGNWSLNSAILSSTVQPAFETPLPHDSPVKLVFHHLDTISDGNVSCEFIDVANVISGSSSWSSVGCHVNFTNLTTTICHCLHLTSFGVLVRLRDFEMPKIHAKSLELISVIGCSISIFSIALTILTFALLGLCKNERMIHVNLCLAIGIGQIIFLAGIGKTENKIACATVAVLLHYFFTAVFCWMLVEGVQLYLQLVVVFDTSRFKRFLVYYLIGWGIPLAIVAISAGIGHQHYGTQNNCWLSLQNGMIFAFVGPVLTVVFFNMAVLGITVRVITQLQTNSPDDKYINARSSLKAAIILLPLLGVTWLFGLLSVNQHTIFFDYIFAILNSLQGFFIFIFYCWNSTEVRSQFARKKRSFLTIRECSNSRGWSTFSMSSNRIQPASVSTDNTSVNNK